MKYLASIFLLSLLAVNASAQITINESDWLSQQNQVSNRTGFTATQSSLSALTPLLAMSGANKTWDFTVGSYTSLADTGTATVLSYPGGYPAETDPDFTTTTHVIRVVPTNPSSPTIYEFMRVTSSGEWALGTTEDSFGTPKKLVGYNPPKQVAAFPMTYQTTWQSTSTLDGPEFSGNYTLVDTVTAVVDGYGTIITPSPTTSIPVLRVKVQTTHSVAKSGSVLYASKSYSYEWHTNGLSAATLATNSTQTTVTSADYWTPTNGGSVAMGHSLSNEEFNLSLTPNPASNSVTNLTYSLQTGGAVQVQLMDELGRSVRMLENDHASEGLHSILIDPTTLVPGSYFIRFEANGSSTMRKLIIQ
jgi:hypothetical protein